ncbi:MAG: tyrosyl-tRNA synthetase [Thermoproteota archaeon]|nr:tyrosyl-tRNA synthetase [Thermoproteota archaeon]
MDLETKLQLMKNVGEEIVTEEELRLLFETKNHPIAYDGFEPSGLANIAFGIYRAINLEDSIKAGINFKILLADWHAWINNKMGGDLEKIRRVGEYFVEVWRAAGVDMSRVEVVWASDQTNSADYWRKVILIAKNTTLNRAIRCLSIMGRTKAELKDTAQLFYPVMQSTDIFHLNADICQLGLDQRRVNMLAREVGPKLGLWKPVVVSHHMLMGLEGIKEPEGYDENRRIDVQISSKMSKSKPSTSLYVHDDEEQIRKKILTAFCPERVIEGNPVIEYCRYIIFRKMSELLIERPSKFGGDLTVASPEELEMLFKEGKIHPLDLKNATAKALNEMVKPIRKHFESGKAKELYEFVEGEKITR